ncbi:MAG: hypothetical protein WD851_14885 [Pirellulales bacterium]
MTIRSEQIVSIVGSGYFQPVADLIERSLKWRVTKRGSVNALYFDNIYAVSMILLMVAALESYATRLRYFHRQVAFGQRLTVANYIKRVFADFRLQKAVTEVFVLRDAIFHNHLWEIDFTWRPMTLRSATLLPHLEDVKFKTAIDLRTRRTRNLRLHLIPTQVTRRDALKVIDVVWKVLLFLERKDRKYCYVSDHHVPFQGKMHLFSEVRDALAKAL